VVVLGDSDASAEELGAALDAERAFEEPLDIAALIAIEFELVEDAAGVTVTVVVMVKIFVLMNSALTSFR